MILFYPLRNKKVTLLNDIKFSQILFSWHLSTKLAALGGSFSLDDDVCCVLSGDSQRIKVLCITMGLCNIPRYKTRSSCFGFEVVSFHA